MNGTSILLLIFTSLLLLLFILTSSGSSSRSASNDAFVVPPWPHPQQKGPSIYIIHPALDGVEFHALQDELPALLPHAVSSRFLSLRQGSAIPITVLETYGSLFLRLYTSSALQRALSSLTGCDLHPLPRRHLNACSLLVYNQEGDYIDYHYDTNYFRGRTFVALLTLSNRGTDAEGYSHQKNCMFPTPQSEEDCIHTLPNQLIVFEGNKVRHRTLKMQSHEQRILFSMVFTEDATQSPLQAWLSRLKDASFFGGQALFQ